ncbi:hypothetical protein RMATCC62417_17464 [Rhizopus microsporus]|nr:hypothetical protein RMATCC62417_17464 [Rhizopus microsporus]
MKKDTNQQDHPTASTISLANKKYLTRTLARDTSHLPENFLWIIVDVRNTLFRAQVFVNYYITLYSQQELNNDIPHCIFRQQFWYSVCQLVNAKRVTASINTPPNMMAVWNVFQSQYSSIVHHQQIAGGILQCLAEACTELATSYHNNMVEHFESRLLSFLYYRLQNIFMWILKLLK